MIKLEPKKEKIENNIIAIKHCDVYLHIDCAKYCSPICDEIGYFIDIEGKEHKIKRNEMLGQWVSSYLIDFYKKYNNAINEIIEAINNE